MRTLLFEATAPAGTSGSILTEITTTRRALEVLPRESATLEVTFDRIVVELKRAESDRAVRFDSAEKALDEAAAKDSQFFRGTKPLRALAGSKIEMVQAPSGLIEEFAGVESVKAKLLEGLDEKDPMRGGVEVVLSFPSLRYLLMPSLYVPDRPVAPGDERKFTDIRPLPETVPALGGLLYFAGTCGLAEVRDGVARIEMKADVSLDPYPGAPPWPARAASQRSRLRLERGTSRAWARIAVETGLLEEDEHVTDLDLYFVRPDGSGEVPIPTRVTQKTKLVK